MHTGSDEASKKYYDAVRNLSQAGIAEIEAHPNDEPGDSAHVWYCKQCYRDMQSHGHGAIDMRQSKRLDTHT